MDNKHVVRGQMRSGFCLILKKTKVNASGNKWKKKEIGPSTVKDFKSSFAMVWTFINVL